jgi:preprotein translocase subunit SecB
MLSVFQLERYVLDAVAVVANPKYDRKITQHAAEIETGLAVSPHNKAPQRYMLLLEVKVRPQQGQEAAFMAYNVIVKGRGFFVFKEPPTKEDAAKALQLNGASILYGLLRGQVAQITAQGPNGQMLLPTLNFLEIQKMVNAKKEAEALKQEAPANPPRARQVAPRKASKRPAT